MQIPEKKRLSYFCSPEEECIILIHAQFYGKTHALHFMLEMRPKYVFAFGPNKRVFIFLTAFIIDYHSSLIFFEGILEGILYLSKVTMGVLLLLHGNQEN